MLTAIFQGPHGIRSGWLLLIFIALAGIPFAAGFALLSAGGFPSHYPNGIPAFAVLVGNGLLFLCPLFAAWVMSRLEHKGLRDSGLPARGAFGRSFWLGAAIGLIALTALLVVMKLGHGFYFGHLALGAKEIFLFSIIWAAGSIVVGLAEEFLFRGYVLATLSEGIGFWPAAILLSTAFGAVHLPKLGENPAGAISAAAVGLLFCFSLRRSGSLWFAIGLHSAWDYGEGFLYSVPNSGAAFQGHLINSSYAAGAPVWLTGGAAGPEGSVLVFAVLAILFVVVDRIYPEVQFPLRVAGNEVNREPEVEAASG
jgi:CAAX protease family protein